MKETYYHEKTDLPQKRTVRKKIRIEFYNLQVNPNKSRNELMNKTLYYLKTSGIRFSSTKMIENTP